MSIFYEHPILAMTIALFIGMALLLSLAWLFDAFVGARAELNDKEEE